MDFKNIIRDAVCHVSELRHIAAANADLSRSVSQVKQIQARRFAGSYADLIALDQYKPAALFFLEELYSEKDYSLRDAQFARIAGPLEKIFPLQVVQTAVSMARLHRLTEELDLAMGRELMLLTRSNIAADYVIAWRSVGRQNDREAQLSLVMEVGHELDRLTRTAGLRLMLKMMRGPATLAGLAALQSFLELGFDTFAAMGRRGQGSKYFLDTVQVRESRLINLLFTSDSATCEFKIKQLIGEKEYKSIGE